MELDLDELLSNLREINEYDFENFVARLWGRYGWQTEVTSGSNDRGVDVIAEKKRPVEQKHLIQVKRWGSGNKVGRPEIQQYSSLRRRGSGIDAVVVVTTSSFSRQAKDEAKDLDVKLVDGSDIYEIISEIDAEDLIKDFIDIGRVDSDSKEPVTHDDGESNSSEDSETATNLIVNKLQKEVHEYRSKVSESKYNTQNDLKISFRDGNGEAVILHLRYSAIYHNAVDFSIRVEPKSDISKQMIERIRTIEGIEHVWTESPDKLEMSSSKDLFAEPSVLSVLINRYHPNFSQDDKLYFDEPLPEPKITSTDESSASENNSSNSLENITSRQKQKDEFDIEKEFDDMR